MGKVKPKPIAVYTPGSQPPASLPVQWPPSKSPASKRGIKGRGHRVLVTELRLPSPIYWRRV